MASPPGSLLWLALLSGSSGYADEARGFLRAAERAGLEPAARDLARLSRDRIQLSREDERMLQAQAARRVASPYVAVHHYQPSAGGPSVDNAVNVMRTMFETDRMPPQWLGPLLQSDLVWLPGQHNVEAFQASGVPESKLRVLGGTLDFDLYRPGVEPYPLALPEGRQVFLCNFAFQERKGWRQLLRAWGRAFTDDDPVCLLLKTSAIEVGDEFIRQRIERTLQQEFGEQGARRLAPVEILTGSMSADDMPRLYAAADAYVLASRGEGWGRPWMEALAMGLPTVASNWSCNLEFMRPETSWLIDGELVPVPEKVELFPSYPGHRWFEPDTDHLAATLREIASDPEAARTKAAPARADLIERFGPEATAARIAELTEEALDLHAPALARAPLCAIRGEFGSSASLAVVNDGLSEAWQRQGERVLRRTTRSDGVAGDMPGITHSWPPNFEPVTGGPTVAILPWEFGAPPAEWVEKVRARVDRVWVPSEYVRQGYIAGGMPPGAVEVVPNGVDLELFCPDGPALPLERRAGCVFLFVGGTIWRKGVDRLLEAWQRAFGPGDDVLLAIKDFGTATHYRGQTNKAMIECAAASGRLAPILYMDDELAPVQLPELYRAADVLVAPYRGEGFCLPALEAMACGLPVIHTGSGPTAEFVPEGGGWAVPAESAPLPPDTELPELAIDGWVHDVDVAELALALRDAAGSRDERVARGAVALERAREQGWEAVADAARRSLETLRAERLTPARHVAPASIEARELTVLYAPDWSREERWTETLAGWAGEFGQDDPVTLALCIPAAGAEALGARIVERLEAAGTPADSLPDLALCPVDGVGLESLVAAADAVLLDEGAEPRLEVARRAPRIATPAQGGLAALRAALGVPGEAAALAAR